MTVTKEEFRKALGRFATGVTVITVTKDNGAVHGVTVNAFASVSLDPPLVLVCIDHRSRTLPLLHARKRFGVNVLTEDQRAIAEYYARAEKNPEETRDLGVRFANSEGGAPKLEGCLAYLSCHVVSTQEAGDHTVFIAQVVQAFVREGQPLLFSAGKYGTLGDEVSRRRKTARERFRDPGS